MLSNFSYFCLLSLSLSLILFFKSLVKKKKKPSCMTIYAYCSTLSKGLKTLHSHMQKKIENKNLMHPFIQKGGASSFRTWKLHSRWSRKNTRKQVLLLTFFHDLEFQESSSDAKLLQKWSLVRPDVHSLGWQPITHVTVHYCPLYNVYSFLLYSGLAFCFSLAWPRLVIWVINSAYRFWNSLPTFVGACIFWLSSSNKVLQLFQRKERKMLPLHFLLT